MLWLGGGAAQIDTFDPKQMGDAKAKNKKPGSYYPSIDTVVKGVQVCEHLPRTAKLLDRATIVRTVNHNVIDEHAAAVNRMHTGRPTSGTIVYPSIGSIVAHEKADRGANVPPYVIMGYPNLTRGPGFLGSKWGYIYLLETEAGPPGLKLPHGVSRDRQARREALVAKLREQYLAKNPDDAAVKAYSAVSADAYKLAGPKFMSTFNLGEEPKSLRQSYGDEFGQRCLLARRLVQRGVRFVEVAHNLNFINGTGWDTHNQGQLNQHELIIELDKAFSTLLLDLEKHKLLDKTLVVISTEFGRPPGFDGGGGRGHQSTAFSAVLAGGGLNHVGAYGVTDDMARKIVEKPVSVPDFFATQFAALGIEPHKELYAGDRPVPITDMGEPIKALFA